MYFLSDQTHRLRGKKSKDYTGTSGRCRQYAGLEDMAEVPLFLGADEKAMPVLSGA